MQQPHRTLLFALLAAATAVSAPVRAATDTPANAPHASAAARASRAPGADDRRFMQQAAHAGHFEVVAGQMAVARAHDPAVRDYGQRLMHDHMAANRKLERIAMNFNVTPPSRPSDAQRQILQRLRGVSGEQFDSMFMEQVGVESHDRAIALFQREARRPGADPALQHFAATTLPKLQEHRRIAQDLQARIAPDHQATRTAAASPGQRQPQNGEAADAQDEVREAVQVVQNMKADPHMADLLRQARGVFILPDYGRAALGIGVQGGQGVLVTRRGNGFGDPAFYNMGGVSIGAQVGASAGQLALLLMTDRAVQDFRSSKKFSLNADAGLTIVNASGRGQVSGGKVQDVIVWSGTSGAYAGASLAVTDIVVDQSANRAYYGRSDATPQSILEGRVDNPHNNVLGMVLAV